MKTVREARGFRMSQPARWNGALGHSPSPAHLVAVIRFGFLNIGRINRRPDVTSNCVLKLAGPKAGRCTGLAKRLGTKCCPRARCVISAEVSAQVYYRFWDSLGRTPSAILPARDFQSLSQHRRLAQYIQPEPNEALAFSRWNCLGKPWHLSYCGIAERP